MVKHIVLYTLKEGVNKEETVEIMSNALESLMGRISGLSWMEVNAVHHGGMDVALYSEFESKQALSDYQKHPLHLGAKEKFKDFIADRYCADYEY